MKLASLPLAFMLMTVAVFGQTLEKRVEALEKQIQALQSQLAAAEARTSGEELGELQRRLQLLTEELARLQHGEAVTPPLLPRGVGLGPAASKVYQAGPGVSIAGYGEVLYQNFASRREDGEPSGKVDTADALRYVLYAGYKFDDRFLFNSELEVEHANTEKGGAVELEFAYVDALFSQELNLRTGMVLVPLGLVNEFHEPTSFFPARRSETESRILPTTWRELGLGLYGDLGPLSFRTYLLTGLDARKFSATGLRGGRQSGAKAKAETLAWVGRVDWTATPGLLAGLGLYWGSSGQGLRDLQGRELKVPTQLLEGHFSWQFRQLTVRALWAQARLGDVAALNRLLGLSGAASVGERLEGGYLELVYDLLPAERPVLAPFIRWETINTQKRVPRSYTGSPANHEKILTLGVAYQPIPNLIFKADWQNGKNQAHTGVDQWNLAVGYVF